MTDTSGVQYHNEGTLAGETTDGLSAPGFVRQGGGSGVGGVVAGGVQTTGGDGLGIEQESFIASQPQGRSGLVVDGVPPGDEPLTS